MHLKSGSQKSSSDRLGHEVLDALAGQGVTGEVIRVVTRNTSNSGSAPMRVTPTGGWRFARILAAQIRVIATPIWLGQPASVAKVVLERLDAELGETDDQGRMLTFGKVAAVAVVGNEHGAHHTCAEVFQALHDVGVHPRRVERPVPGG